MVNRAGIKPWWLVVIAVTIFAGCHGGGGSSVAPLPGGVPSKVNIPRNVMSVAADPVPTITPATVCVKTRDSNMPSHDPTEWSCFLQGGATSPPMAVGPLEPEYGSGWLCSAGTYTFYHVSGGADPPSPLPSPVASFDPVQSSAGFCNKQDSTTLTITFPSPLPQGRWADKWIVHESFTVTAGGTVFGDQITLAEIWLHPGLRIIDNDHSGNEIQNQTWERSVGQRVNISADKPFDQESISSCNWAVPNGISPYAVGSYGTLATTGVSPSPSPPPVMLSPSPMPTTAATGLMYYWAQPFDATQQNVTCSVSSAAGGGNGEGGSALPATQISAILNPYVVAPAYSIQQVVGTIHQGAYFSVYPDEENVSLGTQLDMPDSLGLQSTYTVTMPTDYGGEFGPNQTGKWATVVSPEPSTPPANTDGAYVLDNCSVYSQYWDGTDIAGPQVVPSAGPGVEQSFSTVDAPSSGDYSAYSSLHETDDFVTTLMFKPTTGPGGTTLSNTIWVPLAEFTWGMDGTVINNNPGWGWAPAPAPTQYPGPGTYTYAANPSVFTTPANFPTWPSRYDGNISCAVVP